LRSRPSRPRRHAFLYAPARRNALADVLAEPPAVGALLVAAHRPGFDGGWGSQSAARVLTGLPPPAISRLMSPKRSGDRLRYLEGMAVAAIAARLHRGERAVHMLCNRGLKELRRRLALPGGGTDA